MSASLVLTKFIIFIAGYPVDSGDPLHLVVSPRAPSDVLDHGHVRHRVDLHRLLGQAVEQHAPGAGNAGG